MVITRTPYRISFFGGGTDYPTWFQEHGSAVLATTINHYCYIQCRFLPPFFEHKYRIAWSKIEDTATPAEIQHPVVRAVLKYLEIPHGVEIHCQGDLPARSGLGSSSAFTVSLLHAMYALNGEMSSKRELACEAIHIEHNILKENVGVQDQIETAFGGLNKIVIHPNNTFDVNPVILPQDRQRELQDHLLLFFTGISRNASDIAAEKIKSIPHRQSELKQIHQMVDEALSILKQGKNWEDFGKLLHESWLLKQQMSEKIAPSFINDVYSKARKAGALGGKLLGAGGGGFMLIFTHPENKIKICEALKDLLLVPFEFESSGSQIIFYDKSQYSLTAMNTRDFMHLNNDKRRLTQMLTEKEPLS